MISNVKVLSLAYIELDESLTNHLQYKEKPRVFKKR